MQCAFAGKLGAPFPLLADPEREAIGAYGVQIEIRGMKLAARSVFVVGRGGKIAWIDRRFGVPRSLAGSDLLAALDGLLSRRIEAAVKDVKDPETRALRRLYLRGLSALLRRDAKELRGLLLRPGGEEEDPAKAMIEGFEIPGAPRPSVFDLVDPEKIAIASDKEGVFEVSAPHGREKPARAAFAVKRTEDGYRILDLSE
jgi:hypothetical protein